MIYAYHEIYLSKARSVLGDAFDYAVNSCNISGEDFVKMFVASPVSKSMENGEPAYIAGKSGIEIAIEIIADATGKEINAQPQENMGRSVEYWIGWAVAHYQWYSGRKYSEIFKVISFGDLENMYYPLHEADITKFIDIADDLMRQYYSETNLKRIRTACGCTQNELATRSGVSLRSIQMYEQRNKDINKAGVATVYRLARVMGCTVEDLIEK